MWRRVACRREREREKGMVIMAMMVVVWHVVARVMSRVARVVGTVCGDGDDVVVWW